MAKLYQRSGKFLWGAGCTVIVFTSSPNPFIETVTTSPSAKQKSCGITQAVPVKIKLPASAGLLKFKIVTKLFDRAFHIPCVAIGINDNPVITHNPAIQLTGVRVAEIFFWLQKRANAAAVLPNLGLVEIKRTIQLDVPCGNVITKGICDRESVVPQDRD